jgi:3-oxoacyl-[acyl-carrier protein] reductase
VTNPKSRPLHDRVALVTGASRGIGHATALALSRAGASVAVCSTTAAGSASVSDEIRAQGGTAVPLEADLADPAAAAAMVERTLGELRSVDIVVNNAGITRDGLAVRMSDTDWAAVLAVDLTAAFHICRAALRPMLRRHSGRIINVSSVSGVMGNPGQANYAAAKAGLIGLTKSLAREVGGRHITVNAVAPGFIETEMTMALPGSARDAAVAAIPAGRLGTPVEVAAAIVFLAGPDAAYINGHVLHVDGGLGA